MRLRDLSYEVFCCLWLDNRRRVIAFDELFRGTLDGAAVHTREVVKQALARNAASVIVAHNHPSGVAEPSLADEQVTRRLKEALALIDVRLMDHLVIGDGVCESFAERGIAVNPFPLKPLAGIKRDSFSGPGAMPAWPAPLRIAAMSRVCQITGKRPMTGNTVSHANNRRRRRFLPNLHVQRFWLESERRFVSLRVSTRGLRTIEKKGIEKIVAELRAKGVEL